MVLPPRSHRTLTSADIADVVGSFSTTVETDLEIAVDRTMTWANGTGSHAEGAAASPGRHWYLAEGATHGAFNLFYLIQNPSAAPASVTVNYYRPSPLPWIAALTPCRPTAGSPSGWTRPVRSSRRPTSPPSSSPTRTSSSSAPCTWTAAERLSARAMRRRPCRPPRWSGIWQKALPAVLRPVPAHRQPDRQRGDRRDRLPPARRDGGAEGVPDGAAQPAHGAGRRRPPVAQRHPPSRCASAPATTYRSSSSGACGGPTASGSRRMSRAGATAGGTRWLLADGEESGACRHGDLHADREHLGLAGHRATSASSSRTAANAPRLHGSGPQSLHRRRHRVPGGNRPPLRHPRREPSARSRPNWSWSDRFTAGPGGRPARLPLGANLSSPLRQIPDLVLFRSSGVTQVDVFRPRPGGDVPALARRRPASSAPRSIRRRTSSAECDGTPGTATVTVTATLPGGAEETVSFEVTVSPATTVRFGPVTSVPGIALPRRHRHQRRRLARARRHGQRRHRPSRPARPAGAIGLGPLSIEADRRENHPVDVNGDGRPDIVTWKYLPITDPRQPRPPLRRPARRHLRRGSGLRRAGDPRLWPRHRRRRPGQRRGHRPVHGELHAATIRASSSTCC